MIPNWWLSVPPHLVNQCILKNSYFLYHKKTKHKVFLNPQTLTSWYYIQSTSYLSLTPGMTDQKEARKTCSLKLQHYLVWGKFLFLFSVVYISRSLFQDSCLCASYTNIKCFSFALTVWDIWIFLQALWNQPASHFYSAIAIHYFHSTFYCIVVCFL